MFDSKESIRRGLSKKQRNYFIELKNNSCDECGISSWRNLPVPVEIHHVDSNPHNNSLDNLKLLCLHCHAQTEGWRGKGVKRQRIYNNLNASDAAICNDCFSKVCPGSLFCRSCFHKRNPSKIDLSKEELESLLLTKCYTEIGKMYGLTGASVKKRAKKLGIELKDMRGYWQKKAAKSNVRN